MAKKWIIVILLLCRIPIQSQVSKTAGSVVLLQGKEQAAQTSFAVGTGFLVGDENTLFLVNAQHVASAMKFSRLVTIRGDNDTPINMPLEDLVGDANFNWVFS